MFRPHQATQDLEIVLVLFVAFGILLVIPFLLYSLGGFFIVQPRTQAVVLKFGKVRRTITEEGIHYVFPFGRSAPARHELRHRARPARR